MTFKPTQDWAEELCREITGNKRAPQELSIVAVEVPDELGYGPTMTLYFKFDERGRCISSQIIRGERPAKYMLSGRYEDLILILEGRLSPFAAVPLGKLHVMRGSLGELAEYMPLAMEIVEAARRISSRQQ